MQATRLISRVAFGLAAQQNEYTGCYGKDCEDDGQSAHGNERGQASENEPYG